MSRSKILQFSFNIPITKILKEGSTFKTAMAGELVVFGSGKINSDYEQPPAGAADLAAWITIKIDVINFKDVDLRPVFNLPDAKPLMQMIIRAAENHCHTIATL